MAFIFAKVAVLLKIWALKHYLVSRPITEQLEKETPLVRNIKTNRICVEQNVDCWRHDEPGTLKRAYLLYNDI